MGKTVKTMLTGLKAIVGFIAYNLVMLMILMLTAFLVGGMSELGTVAIVLLSLAYILLGIFVLGWIYRTFWNWR